MQLALETKERQEQRSRIQRSPAYALSEQTYPGLNLDDKAYEYITFELNKSFERNLKMQVKWTELETSLLKAPRPTTANRKRASHKRTKR